MTGIALQSFFSYNAVNLSPATIVIGHTTFCIVVIYNNVIARLRRISEAVRKVCAGSGVDFHVSGIGLSYTYS